MTRRSRRRIFDLRGRAACGSPWFASHVWFGPIISIGFSLGTDHTLFQEGLFFSKAAVVTFGGAYVVLPYVAQQALSHYGWLQPGQMMDGLGLAETTPGPLVMVLQFVGFVGGWNHSGSFAPIVAATAGALLTTWTTFVPCFLWIFLSAIAFVGMMRWALQYHPRRARFRGARVASPVCARSDPLGGDAEAKSTFADVKVLCDRAPAHLVKTRPEIGSERQVDEGRLLFIRPQVALIHLLPVRISDREGTESNLDRFRKPKPDFMRRGL
ncbi:MAG TPA: chromate transporter [Chthoniobacterales bacterium]